MTRFDLHTHSTASDGTLSPTELVQAAAAVGIDCLALSDHDTTAGLAEASRAGAEFGVRIIPAVEISVTWRDQTLHVVGLNIDPTHPVLQKGLGELLALRMERAQEMGRRLAEYGIAGAFEAAQAIAGDGMLTRTHFAQHLRNLRLAGDIRDVFERYLTRGKPGYVQTRWVSLADGTRWIYEAGGVAVIAHPQRYKFTGTKLRTLLTEFKEAGGEGMEVVSGTAPPGEVQSSAHYARQLGMLASCGSDFHGPLQAWPKLGRLPPLPEGLTPVWHAWES